MGLGDREAALVNVLVLADMVPFVRGRTEELCEHLVRHLTARGLTAEAMRIPFVGASGRVADGMLAARSLRLVNVDRLITLTFPASLVPSTRKVIWLIHPSGQTPD